METTEEGGSERRTGGAAGVCLGPGELEPMSNYQQAAPRPAKVVDNNKRQQCLGGGAWQGGGTLDPAGCTQIGRPESSPVRQSGTKDSKPDYQDEQVYI